MATLDYDTEVETLSGDRKTLAEYSGDVLLIVNTASKCGFTPQYAGLEALHRSYADRGLRVLGFPCNQFREQEPGSASEIQDFCQINYGVSFPMHAKVDVNGSGAHPLFRQLKNGAPGFLGTKGIKWNFTKFLVARDGTILRRYSSRTKPGDIGKDIEKALATAR